MTSTRPQGLTRGQLGLRVTGRRAAGRSRSDSVRARAVPRLAGRLRLQVSHPDASGGRKWVTGLLLACSASRPMAVIPSSAGGP
jgi:hypothetical protein